MFIGTSFSGAYIYEGLHCISLYSKIVECIQVCLFCRLEEAREDTRQVERELEEFQENSHQLEKELETQLEQADKTIRELRTRNNRLQLDIDTLKVDFIIMAWLISVCLHDILP
jgi:septal ring factor EnvC (AmiA/AmiB activator)